MKQLTVPLLPDPKCSMPENDAQCVISVKRTSDHSVRWADEMAGLKMCLMKTSSYYCRNGSRIAHKMWLKVQLGFYKHTGWKRISIFHMMGPPMQIWTHCWKKNSGQFVLKKKNCIQMVCWHFHLQWICGYVPVYKIIKQLFHACSGNSQNYCPSVLEMTWELLPSASGNSSQVISSTSGQ